MKKQDLIFKALENETVKNNLTKKQVTSFIDNNTRKKFDNLTIEKNHKKLYNMIVLEAQEWEAARTQKEVKKMIIVIDWKKGSMQAMQSKATANITYKDGSFQRIETSRTGGWGYDKASTSMSQLFNETLRYKLINKRNKKAPYGITLQQGYFLPYYGYGVGVSCYYSIVEYLGGKMTFISETDNAAIYEVIFKN